MSTRRAVPACAASETVLAARAEASAWITRLHGPNRTAEMEAGFRRWLAERPENAEEFEGLTEIWDLVGSGRLVRGVPRLERWEHSEEARELQALRSHAHQAYRPPRRTWAHAAVVLFVCGLVALGAYRIWWTPSYSTDIGEQRIVQLADGTRVSLNSDTRLVVAYSDEERRLYLERGEGFFEVARNPQRPFVVVAGDREVRALGTSFVVRYEPGRTTVTLVEGRVIVTPLSAPEESATIAPGQRLTFSRSAEPRLDMPRIEAVTAWRRGEVVLDDTPLADAVVEMNRYDKTQIVIEDPEIAALSVSGLFHTGDSEGFAHSVARMYGLSVRQTDDSIELSRQSAPGQNAT